jgi:hypothetical protein
MNWRLRILENLIGRIKRREVAKGPYLVIRRSDPIKWTRGDRSASEAFFASPTGLKLIAMCEDAILNTVLKQAENSLDAEYVKGFAAGGAKMLSYVLNHGAPKAMIERLSKPGLPAEEEEEVNRQELAGGVTPMQLQDEEGDVDYGG